MERYIPEVRFETTARKIPADIMDEYKADFASHPIVGMINTGQHVDTPLITQVTESLWMGGTPATLPNKTAPGFFSTIINLYPWESYLVWNDVDQSQYEVYDNAEGFNEDLLRYLSAYAMEKAKTGHVLIHCQAGINRSGIVTGATLVRMGYSPDDAIALMRFKRDPAVLSNWTFEEQLRAFTPA